MSNYHLEFSTQHCLQYIIFLSLKKKNAEMSFLRVNDLIIVCIVQNHDADSPFYIIKNMFSLKIKEIAVGKVCLLVVEGFGSLFPCLKTENDVKLCRKCVTLCPNMAERCRHKKFHHYFILFVYALLVHSLVEHIPNIDCVICL